MSTDHVTLGRSIQKLDAYFGNPKEYLAGRWMRVEEVLRWEPVRDSYLILIAEYREMRQELSFQRRLAREYESLWHAEVRTRRYVCRRRLQPLARLLLRHS